jgi:hypothetical protein
VHPCITGGGSKDDHWIVMLFLTHREYTPAARPAIPKATNSKRYTRMSRAGNGARSVPRRGPTCSTRGVTLCNCCTSVPRRTEARRGWAQPKSARCQRPGIGRSSSPLKRWSIGHGGPAVPRAPHRSLVRGRPSSCAAARTRARQSSGRRQAQAGAGVGTTTPAQPAPRCSPGLFRQTHAPPPLLEGFVAEHRSLLPPFMGALLDDPTRWRSPRA